MKLFLIALCLCKAVLAMPAAWPTDPGAAVAASDDGEYHEELYGFHLYDDPKSFNGEEFKEEEPVQSAPMTLDGGDTGDDGQYREEAFDSQSDDNEQNQEQSVDDGQFQDQSVDEGQFQEQSVDDGQEQSDDGQYHDESDDQSDHQPALMPMAPVADEGDDGQYREEDDTQSHDTQSDDDGQYHPQTYEDGQY